jgi:hypothetical protein
MELISDSSGTGARLEMNVGSMRAPIFYEYNNTAFYLDPDSRSVLSSLQTGGAISTNTSNGATMFGMKSESGKYLTHNAFGQDGGYSWPSTTYSTSNSNSPVGNTTFRGNGTFQGHIQAGFTPIDATKTYRVSVWLRTVSGSPLCYLSHRQYFWDYSPGNPGNGGWGNPYWYVGVPPTSWTEYTMTIGPAGSGADYTHMSGVKFIRHGWLHNYTSDSGALAEFQGWRIEEVDNTLANNTNVLGDLFANRFIDRNNTAYFLDPGGDSGVRAGYLNGNLWINPRPESYGEGVAFLMPNQATWGGLRWVRSTSNFTGAWAFGYFGNESNNDIGFHNGSNGWRLDQSYNMTSVGSVRSPIFYDTNNTN